MSDMLIHDGSIEEATICFSQCKCERHDDTIRYHATVFALIDGVESQLFTYYHDELHFRSSEFIGLTRSQALKLFENKDMAYIRS